jgi:hypothetical protein
MRPTHLSLHVQRILGDPRAALVMRLLLLAAIVAAPAVARAYVFETFVLWARNSIIGPLVFVAIAVTIAAALIRPQIAAAAVWVVVIGLFLMWVLSNGQDITSKLQQAGN